MRTYWPASWPGHSQPGLMKTPGPGAALSHRLSRSGRARGRTVAVMRTSVKQVFSADRRRAYHAPRMATQPTSLRRTRERDLVRATRALFDERGLQDAP